MPSSNLACAPSVLNMAWELMPARVLDVGPGWGKYGVLMREYVNPTVKMEAVEVEPSYVTNMLEMIYSPIWKKDVREMAQGFFGGYDLVLMIDVIEHMPKEDGLELLERIEPPIIICTPRDFFEQHVEGIPSEDHVSHWTPEDFRATGRLDVLDEGAVDGLGAVICRLADLR